MIRLDKLTLDELIRRDAREFPTLKAVSTWRVNDSTLTYSELYRKSLILANYLIHKGLKKGDKVALISEGRAEWPLSYFAIILAGLIAVPVLTDFSREDIEHIIEHSDTKFIISSKKQLTKVEKFIDSDVRMSSCDTASHHDAQNSAAECTDEAGRNAEASLSLSEKPKKGEAPARDADEPKTDSKIPYLVIDDILQLLSSDKNKEFNNPSGSSDYTHDEDDAASIIYTSGTTGTPKAVILTHKNILWNAIYSQKAVFRIKAKHKFLSILPLSHVYEFTIGLIEPFLNGSHITYLGRPLSINNLMPALKEVSPHVILSVPLLIEKVYKKLKTTTLREGSKIKRLLDNPFTSPLVRKVIHKRLISTFGGRLKFFGVGGAPFEKEAEEFLHSVKFPYAIGYGLTETSPYIAGCGVHDQVPGTLGPVLDGLDVKISPENGEILVKGPSVMPGYYKNPDLTTEVFTKDGYFKTGDIGEFVENRGRSRHSGLYHTLVNGKLKRGAKQRLAIKGRSKTMILTAAGENIYPENIEFLIDGEDSVLESLIIPDNGTLKALVRLDLQELKRKGGFTASSISDTLELIRNNVNKRLSSFSKIHKIEYQEEPFERTPTNKIKRFLYQKKQ